MNTGKTLFAQLMEFLPWKTFSRIVARYGGDNRVRTLSLGSRCIGIFGAAGIEQVVDLSGHRSSRTAENPQNPRHTTWSPRPRAGTRQQRVVVGEIRQRPIVAGQCADLDRRRLDLAQACL